MKKYRIFISGVPATKASADRQKELKQERQAVKDFIGSDALLRKHFDAFLFKELPRSWKIK